MNSDDLAAVVEEANLILVDHGYTGPALTRAQARAMYMAMQQLGLGAAAPQRTVTRRHTFEETVQEPVGLVQRVRLLIGGDK